MAGLSLAGVFISLNLDLHKLGFIGQLACGADSCETLRLASSGRFLGPAVALILSLFCIVAWAGRPRSVTSPT